jgi:methylated-DNA-[protein]-cysteine S-methyltransferase
VETLYYSRCGSPVGPLGFAVSDQGLVALHFDRDGRFPPADTKQTRWVEDAERTAPHRAELEQYFRGERRAFNLPLDLRGTDFQKSCWRELLRIPYGETRTYADIARAIGKPNAFRAVGMANHDNPIAIIVPCHRVLASNGGLCGYGGGLDIKQKLLELEGAKTAALTS